jgi:hypothetical protein
MTIRINREQYAKDLSRIIKPDPLDIDPIQYSEYKKLLKERFMVYVPSKYKNPYHANRLDNIFDELVSITTQFQRNDVEEAVQRLITL